MTWCKVLIYVLFYMSSTKKLQCIAVFSWFLILGKVQGGVQDGDHCWWGHRPPAAPTPIKYTSSCWEDQRQNRFEIQPHLKNSGDGVPSNPPPPPPSPLYCGGGKTLRVRPRANWNIYLYSSLQVIKVTPSGNLFLVEVISANFNENGTISTVVEAEKLQNFHRRKRRSTDDDQMSLEVFNTGQIKHTVKKSDVFILYRFCNQC